MITTAPVDTPPKCVSFQKINLSDWTGKDTTPWLICRPNEEGVGAKKANGTKGDEEAIVEVQLEKGMTKTKETQLDPLAEETWGVTDHVVASFARGVE